MANRRPRPEPAAAAVIVKSRFLVEEGDFGVRWTRRGRDENGLLWWGFAFFPLAVMCVAGPWRSGQTALELVSVILLPFALVTFASDLGLYLIPWERREGSRRLRRSFTLTPAGLMVWDGQALGTLRPHEVFVLQALHPGLPGRHGSSTITSYQVLLKRERQLLHVYETHDPDAAHAVGYALLEVAARFAVRRNVGSTAPERTDAELRVRELGTTRWPREDQLALWLGPAYLVAFISLSAPTTLTPGLTARVGWLAMFVVARVLIAPLRASQSLVARPRAFSRAFGQVTAVAKPLGGSTRLWSIAFAIAALLTSVGAAVPLVALIAAQPAPRSHHQAAPAAR